MKNRKYLETYIQVFLIETILAGFTLYFLTYYKILLVLSPPYFTPLIPLKSPILNDFDVIRHNIQALTCLFLLAVLLSLAIFLIRSRKHFIKRIFWYLISSVLTAVAVYFILKPWIVSYWVVLCGLALGYLPMASSHNQYLKDNKNNDKILRGSIKLADEKAVAEFKKLVQKESPGQGSAGLKIWKDLSLPLKRENEHLLVIGSTGSGKTQIIFPLVEQIIQRGDKIIIWDVKGTYTQALMGKEKVNLLAPWDKRSINWCIGKDICNTAECLSMAQIILPQNFKDPQPYFLNSARQVLEASMLHFLSHDTLWGWGDLWEFLIQGRKKLAEKLMHTSEGRAAKIAIEASNRSSQDVYSTMITACKSIRWFAKAWPKEGVSLREWVKSNKENVLILGGIPERADLAAMTANLALNILVNEILSMPDDLNRRIWLVLDEFGSLPKNDQLINAFTAGRSKGLCTILGIQDIGRIQFIYGRELSKTIINSFNASIFLRCTDPETNQWISQYLGEQEVREHHSTTESISKSGAGKNKQESKTESVHRKLLYLPSEMADLESMTGILKVSGWPSGRLKWPLTKIPQNNAIVVNADWINEKPIFDEFIVNDDFHINDLNDEQETRDNRPNNLSD